MKQLFLVAEMHGRTWDPGKPMNGQAQWPEHAAFMNRLAADGFVVLGGPLGESDDVLLIVDARSADDIRATLAMIHGFSHNCSISRASKPGKSFSTIASRRLIANES